MAKANKVINISVHDIDFSINLNIRFANNMDIPGMVQAILAENGVVLEPIHVLKLTKEQQALYNTTKLYAVMRGNRRAGGCLYIVERPKEFSKEVIDNASFLPALIYEKSIDEAKQFVIDHAEQKRLSKSEVIAAIMLLVAAAKKEGEIIMELYSLIIDRLLGDEGLRKQVEKMTNLEEREKLIKTKCHNVVYGLVMRANKLGPWVMQQLLYNFKKTDGLLETDKGEMVHLTINTNTIKDLWAAYTADSNEGAWVGVVTDVDINEEGVKVIGGGPKTAELIEKMVLATKTGTKPEKNGKVKQPTIAEAKQMEGSYRTPIAQQLLKFYQGEKIDPAVLIKADSEAFRNGKVMELIRAKLGNVVKPDVKALLTAIANEPNMEKVEESFKPFQG